MRYDQQRFHGNSIVSKNHLHNVPKLSSLGRGSAPESRQTRAQSILVAGFGLMMMNLFQVLAERSDPQVDIQRLLVVCLLVAGVGGVSCLARRQRSAGNRSTMRSHRRLV